MIRRISTKWLLAVLASVVVPFVGLAWYIDVKLADRLSNDLVRFYLLSFAVNQAQRIDDTFAERRLDVDLWVSDPMVGTSLGAEPGESILRLEERFDRFIRRSDSFDALLVIDAEGFCVVCNGVDMHGLPLPPETLVRILDWKYAEEEWFQRAAAGEATLVDHHVSSLLHEEPLLLQADPPSGFPDAHDYGIGIAEPIYPSDRPEEVIGVVYGLLNWSVFQNDILDASRPDTFDGLIGSQFYSTSYSWLWKADGNSIIGHQDRKLYGKKVAEDPVNLPQLVEAALSSNWDMYPEYEFKGVRKHAAFKHCASPEDGGLGWVLGIGIDNEDIYATVNELHRILVNASVLVLVMVILWTVFIARRTTQPILELQKHTQRVADGDLDARLEVKSHDELGQLARAFNRMTAEISESRERLVQAEKEAAWREMARQIAHEIKNPLTPIGLSVNLLRRARDEESEDFDAILDRTLELIGRQVENMRQIAQNFYLFAGQHLSEPREVDPRAQVEEVCTLNAAWADELGVETRIEGRADSIHVDPTEFRRVLINLVSNAFEAMPDGGTLEVRLGNEDGRVRMEIRDSGPGIAEEVRQRLFEPYFTTRTSGTGLGLAICKRVIDELGGEIRLEAVPEGEGTGTVVVLLLPRAEGS